MADKDPRLIAVRRSTVVRFGVVVLVLVSLGVGTAIGLAVGSKSSPPTKSTALGASTTTEPVSTTTSSLTSTTTPTSVPAVLSCGPGPTPHVRPTTLTIGCVSCRGWHFSGRLNNSLEGRVDDCPDREFVDWWEDHFDHSPDDDHEDWWHYTGRGVTARFWMGWQLNAPSFCRSRRCPHAR